MTMARRAECNRERKTMTGRPVPLLTAAAFTAAASLLSASSASANCGGCGFGYAAPVMYAAPVTYSISYATPVAYGSCANPCGYGGYGGYGYASPMYVVNQGPTYNAPVVGVPEPAPSYAYGYGEYPYIGTSYGYRSYGYGYRHHRWGYRGWSPRGIGRAHV